MEQANTAELDRAVPIRLLIRWIQHEGGLDNHGGGARLEDISEALGLSRTQLNRFLHKELNTAEEQKRADALAQRLRSLLENRRSLPPAITRLMEDLYGPQQVDLPEHAVVTDPAVLRMRSMMTNTDHSIEYVEPFFGLNIILRQANGFVKNPDGAELRGWSLSLLNMPPSHIQRGEHHPVFKMIQTSRAGNRMRIEGIALARRDRLTLQGIETRQRRSFTASVALPDDDGWPDFRKGLHPLNGVMLGLSSTRANFGCLFELFHIPNSMLIKDGKTLSEDRFRQLHAAAREATGVRNLEETVDTLRSLGIKATENHLARLKQRGDDSPLLSVF